MDKHLWGLNPNLQSFLEKKPDITLIGLSWAIYWRFTLIIIAIEMVFFAAIMILGFVAGQ